MAATARAIRMASRLSAVPRPIMTRSANPSLAQRAAFTVSARRLNPEDIKETEVPVSLYKPGVEGAAPSSPVHYSIPVKPGSADPEPVAELDSQVKPLSKQIYSEMPRTLQKMSVMDKVIIVTG